MAISNAAIATDIEEARNTLTQIYWRVQAHNTIEDAKWQVRENETKDKPWFIDEDYDESIKQVIGKAIADCVTNMNEFKDKKAGDLITFEGQDYKRPEDYTQENWNAVVLYNYVNDLIKLKNNSDSAKKMIANCVNRILNYYKSRLSDQRIQFTKECLIKANKDINKYVEVLSMTDKLLGLAKQTDCSKENNVFSNTVRRSQRIVSYCNGCDRFAWMTQQPIKTLSELRFDYRDGRLGIVSIKDSYYNIHSSMYKYQFMFYDQNSVEMALQQINFYKDLADLLKNGKLSIFVSTEEERNEYEELNAPNRGQMDLDRDSASLNPLGELQADYNRRLINARMKSLGLKSKID